MGYSSLHKLWVKTAELKSLLLILRLAPHPNPPHSGRELKTFPSPREREYVADGTARSPGNGLELIKKLPLSGSF